MTDNQQMDCPPPPDAEMQPILLTLLVIVLPQHNPCRITVIV